MASYRLDETANFSQSTARTIEDYARACSKAVDEAVEAWPVVATTENARVSTGFVGDNLLLSTLWTQSFDVVPKEEKNPNGSTQQGSKVPLEDLLNTLKDVFASEDLGKHATKWDRTYAGASLLGKLSEDNDKDDDDADAKNNGDTILVHWKFDASPLAGRDMLYVVHKLEETNRDEENGTHDPPNPVMLRWTYAYASVSDEWASRHGGKPVDEDDRVRAYNCFPSCDRITVYRCGSSGDYTLTVDHLMTTDVGGWIGPFCYNHFFREALIQANRHECEAMRAYVLSLCEDKNENENENDTNSNKHAA